MCKPQNICDKIRICEILVNIFSKDLISFLFNLHNVYGRFTITKLKIKFH